ncbi:MAG: ABC transporter ATP-binding protein [Halobacteriales archaeon]|nr:ABC transporter ATP-binding protein [Halobacteriales archaeon]
MSSPDPQPAGMVAESAPVSLTAVGRTYQRGEAVQALDDVSLDLPSGSYTAIMGPSGSGKSTLLNLIGCLDTPTTGQVMIDGRDVSALSADERAAIRGEAIGFVFQTFNLMPRLSAIENVALPLVFQGWDRTDRRRRATELLERVGLGDRTDHRPPELSGGQRQRVAIARALAPDPVILLADEPTGNIDTDTGARILELFDDLHAAGNTILLVSHERRVAAHADRIVHLLDGRIESIESVAESPAETHHQGEA